LEDEYHNNFELPEIIQKNKVLNDLKNRSIPMKRQEIFSHIKQYKNNKLRLEKSLKAKREANIPVSHYNPSKYQNYFTNIIKKEGQELKEKSLLK